MKILGLDLETTGLLEGNNDKDHRIIEIAAIIYSDNKVQKWEQRIQPKRSIDAKAQEVHGISLIELSGKPTWKTIAPKIHKLLSSVDLLVAHNGDNFDFKFLRLEFERIGMSMPTTPTFDTMVNGNWATAFGKPPNLGELCFATGVEYDKSKAHAALYDVKVMMDAYFEGVKLGFFEKGECK